MDPKKPDRRRQKLTEGHVVKVGVTSLQNEDGDRRVFGQPRGKSEPGSLGRKDELRRQARRGSSTYTTTYNASESEQRRTWQTV